jgi:acyl-CoA synthetase (NDP forming)
MPTRSLIDRLLRPRSIVIVGASSTPGSTGGSVLDNLERAGYEGDIHLINPKRAEIGGRKCLPSVADLPEGVDCAIMGIPRVGVLDAVKACAARKVGAAIIYAAGYAEAGEQGKAEQEEISRIARENNMAIEGPNCLGPVNYVDGIPLTFIYTKLAKIGPEPRVGIVSQSGAMSAVLGVSLASHGLPLSFTISTGNEAVCGVEDFVEYLLGGGHTRVITMIVEQFRQPQRFLALAERARKEGKYIVLLHPGRSSAARASAATHTGAMAGDYNVMLTKVSHAGVVVVETLEELVDVSDLLLRIPSLPRGGAAVMSDSGAFKAMTLDFCESIGLALPPLPPALHEALKQVLPEFVPPSNPADLTAQALVDPDLYKRVLPHILGEDSYGSVVLGVILTDESTAAIKFPRIIAAIKALKPKKPVIFAALDEGAAFDPVYPAELRALGVPFFPSPERAYRALGCLTRYAANLTEEAISVVKLPSKLPLKAGVMPEYRSKEVLAAAGIRIPAGGLAKTLEEAQSVAARIGFPVVLKAQAVELTHKSDAGGVVLNLANADELAAGWKRLQDNIARAKPGLKLDGVLVEQMGQRGAELIVGAQNDKDWGPVLLVGFGGVLAEALHDVRLLAPESSVDAVIRELYELKSAALLRGFRGSPALDVKAAAEIVCRLGALMHAAPEIKEVDINPVVVYPAGQGAVALDALIVTDRK